MSSAEFYNRSNPCPIDLSYQLSSEGDPVLIGAIKPFGPVNWVDFDPLRLRWIVSCCLFAVLTCSDAGEAFGAGGGGNGSTFGGDAPHMI